MAKSVIDLGRSITVMGEIKYFIKINWRTPIFYGTYIDKNHMPINYIAYCQPI